MVGPAVLTLIDGEGGVEVDICVHALGRLRFGDWCAGSEVMSNWWWLGDESDFVIVSGADRGGTKRSVLV